MAMRIRRTLPFALLLSFFAGACGVTKLTPQQEFTMGLFSECRTRTNAINVRLDQVYPDGSWSATVNQTQSDYNHVVACMQNQTVRATIYRREADGGNAMAMADQMYEFGSGGLPKNDAEAIDLEQAPRSWWT